MSIPHEMSSTSPFGEGSPAEGKLQTRLEKALRTLLEGESMQTSPDFPDEVNERIPHAAQNAAQAVAKIPADVRPNINRLLNVAVQAQTKSKSVMWLHHAADAVLAAYGPHAACKAGCSHCCHIPVAVSASEARILGRAIGRKPVPRESHQEVRVEGYNSPCPFLRDGECSVYKHRPTVCRTHLNLDIDDLLCRLIPGQTVPVPYLDTLPFTTASVAIDPSRDAWADIRQWFP